MRLKFCPSELGTREAADLLRSTAKLQNAVKPHSKFVVLTSNGHTSGSVAPAPRA